MAVTGEGESEGENEGSSLAQNTQTTVFMCRTI